MSKFAIAVVAVLLPGVAVAHPDHLAGGSYGLLHFVSDPFHIGLTALALLGGLALLRSARSAAKRSDR